MSNRNEKRFWRVERGQCVKRQPHPPPPLSVSQLSRHCGILNISHLYKLSRTVSDHSRLRNKDECQREHLLRLYTWAVIGSYEFSVLPADGTIVQKLRSMANYSSFICSTGRTVKSDEQLTIVKSGRTQTVMLATF
jgi:hypothetical protein